jgi:enoyl-CoA hydratase/carnithine racemase
MAEPGMIRLERVGAVAVLLLDNPPVNALTRAMVAELQAHLAALAADDAVGCVLLRGAGERAFCAGSDLREFPELLAAPGALAGKFAADDAAFGRLAHFPKPTLAAIAGIAFGGGLELAVCCDIIVAAPQARFALPEIALGAFPGSGGTVRVTRRIGAARAREMMLLGDPVDAATALAWGLVNRVGEDAVGRALALATRLADGPARALQHCKQALDAAADLPETQALDAARAWAEELAQTADLREGVAAFLERRAPRFGDRIAD